MKKLLLGTSVFAGLLVAGAAIAADLPAKAPYYKAPPARAYYSWTGCYLGGNVGGAWSRDHFTLDNGVVVEPFSFDPSSFIGGAQVGCQGQFNNVVLGIEGTWSGLRLHQTDTSALLSGRLRTFKLDEIATVVGRLGFTWDRWMLYGKGGFAEARIDTFAINPATGVNIDINKWQSGVTAGFGLEYMIAQNFVLGAEFDWYNFKFGRSGFATDATFSRFFDTKADVFAVTGRLSWLFNWGGPLRSSY